MKRASPAAVGVAASGALGAVLLGVAEFTNLFEINSSARGTAVPIVTVGSHHSYAMIPIALLALLLICSIWLTVSRAALLALGGLGVIVLLIALIGDLPDAQATGLLRSTGAPGVGAAFINAGTSPAVGLYLETLGGVLLLIGAGLGLLALGPPAQRADRRRPPTPVGDRSEA